MWIIVARPQLLGLCSFLFDATPGTIGGMNMCELWRRAQSVVGGSAWVTTIAALVIVSNAIAPVCAATSPTTPARAAPEVRPAQNPARSPVRTHQVPLPGVARGEVERLVLRGSDIPEEDWKPGHRGVDLRADPGQEIVASRGGVVAFAGVVAGTPIVSIQHSDGLRTTYEPVHAAVAVGQHVRRGAVIGHLADADALPETARRSPGLSWGAKWGSSSSYVDPLTLLGDARVRLVPPDSVPDTAPDPAPDPAPKRTSV